MTTQRPGGPKAPTQVQHVRRALLQGYSAHVYDDDLKGYDQAGREQRLLSRGLAAAAVRVVSGCDHRTAGKAVIDGEDDQGIDAVWVSDTSQTVWLVQAKWSDSGRAKMDKSEALKFIDGFRLIDQRDFTRFNERLAPLAGQLDAAMGDARLQVVLVIAVMGDGLLSDAVEDVLERARADLSSGWGPMLSYRILSLPDFHRQIRHDLSPEELKIGTRMTRWIRKEAPFDAWQGTVAVKEVAEWYAQHGSALFEQNVRNSLGLTRINSGIKQTLLTEPENFWYFNNGITVLCDKVEPQFEGRRRPDEAVNLQLSGVSVVNGAQTVTAIHEAMQEDPKSVEDADVTVRVFSLGAERSLYAKRITETTNTQNDVSRRDFIALDSAQAEIREDFLLSLGKSYVYKRGELDPAPEAGCSVVHAAIALACAHRSPELAVRASQDTDLLWDRGTAGAYPRLFGEVPSAQRIWRLVLMHRAVGAVLIDLRRDLHGRGADISRRGELLITHLVFQFLDEDEIDDPSVDWDSTLERASDLVQRILMWLIFHVDQEYGEGSFLTSTFNDEVRCKNLAKLVLADVRRDGTIPVLPDSYTPPAKRSRKLRRPNAVVTIVNSGRLRDGHPVTFQPKGEVEIKAVDSWLKEDPQRSMATWINDRRKCLLWAYDGQTYSATGLVNKIWEFAGYEKSPVAVQGPARWFVNDQTSLWDLSLEILNQEAEEAASD
ncbi:AIPR family protein [Herbidospora sp. NBRC 101105]|uniref:AIPR family protein n=1 Tax=Herbidospora sp. NBRC 101105 TaxID=3032195 RepID=UPI0024A5E1E4|nr:AIPR family protein [Herbidospora sp. NBRC 101105]GLX98642.1 hypothetical protein Hesp01_65920 [Herbidospora sp. NBRC 101105]